MFDKRFWWTGAALAITITTSMLLAGIPEAEDIVPLQEPVSGIERELPPEENIEPEAEYAYLIREYDGRIAVFTHDGEEPQIVFDVLVKFLPDYDRIQMKNGIPVKDYEALSSIIEDYIS